MIPQVVKLCVTARLPILNNNTNALSFPENGLAKNRLYCCNNALPSLVKPRKDKLLEILNGLPPYNIIT